MKLIGWTSVSMVGAVGCTAGLSTFADYRFFFLPPLLSSALNMFYFPLYLYASFCHIHPSSFSGVLLFGPLNPCSKLPPLGLATMRCRAALRTNSATAGLGVQGPAANLQRSMRPCIIWTGCLMVSVQHANMRLWVFSRCQVYRSSSLFLHLCLIPNHCWCGQFKYFYCSLYRWRMSYMTLIYH